MKTQILTLLFVSALAGAAGAQGLQVIYTEIATHPTSTVPGALDAAGLPVVAQFIALEDLALRHDGAQWMLKGRTNQATTLDSILLLGGGTSGTAFAQDGQPFQGGVAGELYDFFDTPIPAAWDETGKLAFSARAKGGLATTFEKVVVFDGVSHTIVHQMGDPALGLIDIPANPTGDELFGNSINSVYLRNDGLVGFVDTPIQNCSSTRYPAYFLGSTSFRQSGVSPIGAEIWDSFGLSDVGGTPDGAHWFAEGDTENPNTLIDGILAVDDVVVIQEGMPINGVGPVVSTILFTRMLSNGSWFSRGGAVGGVWAVRNGVILGQTGGPVAPGESWASTFSAFGGNHLGNWILAGATDNPDTLRDNVLLLDGTTVLARENDPVDLDGDGLFSEGAFLASFQPDSVFLTDDMVVYFLATLRNAAGTSLGDAFLRLPISGNTAGTPLCWGDGSGSGATPCPCANTGAPGHGCENSAATGGSQLTLSGTTAPDTIQLAANDEIGSALTIFLQGSAIASPAAAFGDGRRCADGTLIRLYVKTSSAGGSIGAPAAGDPPVGVQSASLGDPIAPGSMRVYQVYYRDPDPLFCPAPAGSTFNVSNGVQLIW